jgi:hypothetical protein
MKALFFVALMMGASAAATAESRPVVVELFTSQSCSSCPPADALLAELARRPELIALGFHVTYWDSAAWRDPFARRESTERQALYDRRLTGGQAYTPQMVIDGRADALGSDRTQVLAAIGRSKPLAATAVSFAPDRRSVAIAAGTAPAGATVFLVRYVGARTTRVGGGENASRTLADANAVTALTPPAAGEGLAVLVQAGDGHMLGAAELRPQG